MSKVDLNVDTSGEAALAGYMTGLSTVVSSKRYLDSATSYAYSTLTFEFGVAMDAEAALHPNLYHHVYEWGDSWDERYSKVGNRLSRLWTLRSTGSGGKRTLMYIFLPSIVPSPVNPQLTTPGKTGESVKTGVHVFTWKSTVMEYGLSVSIVPQLARALAFPSGIPGQPIFKQQATAVPGEGGTMGMFTGFYEKWWNVTAPVLFDTTIRPKLESDVADESGLHAALASRRRSMSIEIGNKTAFEQGKSAAEALGARTAGRYVARAAERRFDEYGDEYDD